MLEGDQQAKTTDADPDPVNEPCYSASSCRPYGGGNVGYVCCVAVGTCDHLVSNNARYYVGG